MLRPEFGVYLEIVYTDTDKARSVKVLPHMVTALDAVLASSRELAGEMTADEVRPVVPGEQPYYEGPLYPPAYRDPVLTNQAPRPITLYPSDASDETKGVCCWCTALYKNNK